MAARDLSECHHSMEPLQKFYTYTTTYIYSYSSVPFPSLNFEDHKMSWNETLIVTSLPCRATLKNQEQETNYKVFSSILFFIIFPIPNPNLNAVFA